MQKNRAFKIICGSLMFCAVVLTMIMLSQINTFAADAFIGIAGGEDTHMAGESYTVGITIDASERIGTYYVELEYDASTAVYLGGAESVEDGKLILTGTGTGASITYEISLMNIAEGTAELKVKSAILNDTSKNAMDTRAGSAYTNVPDIPIIGRVRDSEGQTLYIVDHSELVPDVITWKYKTVVGEFMGQGVTYITDLGRTIRVLCMMDSGGGIHVFAINGSGKAYPLNQMEASEGRVLAYASVKALPSIPDDLMDDPEYVIYAIDESGIGGCYCLTDDNELVECDRIKPAPLINMGLFISMIAVFVIALGVQIILIIRINRREKEHTDSMKPETAELL